MTTRVFSFVGDVTGEWEIAQIIPVAGEALAAAARLSIVNGLVRDATAARPWILRGATSNERYVTRPEKSELVARQPALGRVEATRGALIPIRKNAAWWAMTQDERRAIFEEQSRHIQTGMRFLPAVARRLHHCRDLGEAEPFDFLTWFEFAPEMEPAFDELLRALRASPEWQFVDREVDVRVVRG